MLEFLIGTEFVDSGYAFAYASHGASMPQQLVKMNSRASGGKMHYALAQTRNATMTVLAILASCSSVRAQQRLEPLGVLKLSGNVAQPDEISGITFFEKWLVVCPDEEASFSVLKQIDAGEYTALPPISLLDSDDAELDLEGAASDDRFVYLVGSHGLARKAVKPERTFEENRKRFAKIEAHDGADSLFRLRLDAHGAISSKEHISLRSLLESDVWLKPFNKIPSKENGIDIEGIAAKDGKLYLGFRGPVLRDNYVPLMVLKFEHPHEYELRFVDLGGRGIRDIAAVQDGFLIVGGPIGEGPESYELYLWDGDDCIPGEGSPDGKIVPLATLPSEDSLKPEGIAVTEETETSWEIVVVRDGETNATRFRVPKGP